MAYELVRTIVQKILQDKLLLGLVIIGILGIFVGGASMGDSPDKATTKHGAAQEAEQAAAHGQPPGQPPEQTAGHPPGQGHHGQPAAPAQPQAAVGTNGMTPVLATEFVRWWLERAMDYHPRTAAQNHQEAIAWMTADGARDFSSMLWTPSIAESVCTGRVTAAFQPTAIQAQAINPDGSIVVGVTGTVIIQGQGQPVVHQFLGNFLVKKRDEGLCVAGLYTRQAPLAIY